MDVVEPAAGLLRLPNEVLLEALQLLDPADPGIFALSTSCRRLHFLALPIHLAAYGITDTQALGFNDIYLLPSQLDVLRALQTALFIPAVKHVSCCFSLNSARPNYTSLNLSAFLGHIRRLAGFLSILEWVDEVTLNFKDVNFWVMGERLDDLEAWDSALSMLLNVILQKHCKTLKVESGMFMVHQSQLQGKPKQPKPSLAVHPWSVVHDVGRRIGSAFVGKAESQQVSPPALRTFNIHSRLLLLHPCYKWTLTALNSSPNLTSLSIIRVEIPENNWDDILSSIHVPPLKYFSLDLRYTIKTATLDHFLVRHPRLTTLNLGRDLVLLKAGEVDAASKDCLHHLRNLSAAPPYVRFLVADKRAAPAVRNIRLQIKVTSRVTFDAATINQELVPCRRSLERIHLTLVIMASSAPPREDMPDALRGARALEMVSMCPSDAFEALVLRLLPSFPALESVTFSRCMTWGPDPLSLVRRLKEVCPAIQAVTLDGTKYDATSACLME
ncbi:hypothetical protein MSAN_00670000 [Mycena sanguinolenta]|uniref:F-box domain-containing protein n=1 Tax=Mycena sanguinolenta TaxID=230812 RepID=A0A8H6Z6Z9_9AGAR|nr:hypothetical protein MSAN_00670000 [Mycena sanguinolenta]